MAHSIRRLASSRAIHALVLALVVQAAGLAAVAVTASGPDPAGPLHVAVPIPDAGRTGLYRVEHLGDPPDDAARLHSVDIAWTGPSWRHAADGTPRVVRTLQLDLTTVPADGADEVDPSGRNLTTGRSHRVHVDPSTGEVVSVETLTDEVRERGSVRLGPRELAQRREVRVHHEEYADPSTPCGWTWMLAHRKLPVGEPVEVPGCGGPDRRGPLRVAGRARIGNRTVVEVTATETGVRAWYPPNGSLPLRIEGPPGSVLGGRTPAGTSTLPSGSPIRLDRVRTDAGRKSADRPDEPRPAADHAHEIAPRRPWGPAERDVGFYLPLSEAHGVLTDDPDVDSWLNERPGAYLARGWMHRRIDDAGREHVVWQMVLTDGRSHLERFVAQAEPLADGQGIRPVEDLEIERPPRVRTREEVAVDAPRPDERYPRPEALPDRLPVVDGGDLPEDNPLARTMTTGTTPHWAFEMACGDPGCASVRTVVELGQRRPAEDEPHATTDAMSGADAQWTTGLDARGRRRYHEHVDTEPAPLEARDPHRRPDDLEAAAQIPAPGRSLSPERAAAAGILAALTGLLYYIWPKFKAVGATLYSRIDPDEVLDHDTRREIRDMVADEPGIHFREIKRRVETGSGNLDHHLDKLTEADVLVEHATDGYRCYFLHGTVDRRVVDAADRLRSESARTVLAVLQEGPCRSIAGLADAAGLSTSTVRYHLERLEEAGLLDAETEGRRKTVRLTGLGRRAIDALQIA